MQEIELKFQVPAAKVAEVRAAIEALSPGSGPLPLHAAYYDTADNALARQKMALRVRREGDQWVQTFKAAGQDAMTRVEDNQPRQVTDQRMPMPDLALHPLTARQALMQALPWEPGQDPGGQALGLKALYETRFERRQAMLDGSLGQVIACIDEGEITAGSLREPLAELELELSSGHPQAVLAQARLWAAQHGLWLDVQSKAHRGTRLAKAMASGQPASARPVAVGTASEPKALLNLTLDAAAGNWSEVAAGRPGWSAALIAWRQALIPWQAQAQQPASMASLLPDDLWRATAEQWRALDALLGACTPDEALRREQDASWRQAAHDLSTSLKTTLWGLRTLEALQA